MFLFVLFLTVWTASDDKTDGAWAVTYLDTKECTGMEVATYLTNDCVVMEEYTSSFRYTCDQYNVSIDIYHSDSCEKEGHHVISSVVFEETNTCAPQGDEFQEWYCTDDYSVTFDHLEFDVPLHVNDSSMGTLRNPVVGHTYIPTFKCKKLPDSKYHLTIECDKDSQEGEIKVYELFTCLVSLKTVKVEPGQSYNFGEISGSGNDYFLKYVGCTTS